MYIYWSKKNQKVHYGKMYWIFAKPVCVNRIIYWKYISFIGLETFLLFFSYIFALGQMRRSSLVPQATEENRRSLMLFAIVIVFLICHTPRTFLNLYEVWNAKRIMLDIKNHCLGIPLSILFTQQASHLLLAINSSVNFFLYCAMSPLFLQQLSEYFTQLVNNFYQCCCAVYMKGMYLDNT